MFPDVPPGPLCQLSELGDPAPSDVLELVPTATSDQIAEFFRKLKNTPPPTHPPAQSSRRIQPVSGNVSLTEEFKSNSDNTEDDRHIVEKIFHNHQMKRRGVFRDAIRIFS